MHAVRHEDRSSLPYAEFLAQQSLEIRTAAATAESMAEEIHVAVGTVARFVREWLVLPVKAWYRRGKLSEEMMGMDDRALADIGISRAQVQWVVSGAFSATETPRRQSAEESTIVHLPVENREKPAGLPSEESRRPMAA